MLIKKGSIGNYVSAWQDFLNKQGYPYGNADGIFGNQTENSTKDFQTTWDLGVDGVVGPVTIAKGKELGFAEPEESAHGATPSGTGGVTMEQFSYIMRGAKRSVLETHLEPCNKCMVKFEINTPLRKQHFLSQVGHESASLKYMQEIASGAAYEGRSDLGNTEPGDGRKFKGRGPIQLTGRLNYTSFARYMGDMDIVEHPERLETDMELCWASSGWFWTEYKHLNRYADQDDVRAVTLRVNGGYNGLADREQYLARAKEVIPS